ncbi:beta-fructofuranosidase, insoluble isoenzyme 1 [Carica papaya]|uniref:Cell wall invertase n=1 Tax=Carica papaya TaxID=3649 RepID=Q944U7_CARPA|nr:beta-fructofuranosidase, insoluble isoenzyme 1 [Carica papaya]AAL16015.1 cell wall invertase [Carica papaya]
MSTASKFYSVLTSTLFCYLAVITFIGTAINGVEASHRIYPQFQSLSVDIVDQIHRTAYHFQPPKHWINDPNAPMYYNGVYHLFYQYNPKGAVWGNIVWAHSVSTDLINWIPLKPAIVPSEPFDIKGCWSGSATVLPNNIPIILYTGLDSNETQLQNYAVPANISDPHLENWIKPANNPLVAPDHTVNRTAFRDPTTAWLGSDGWWRMLVGSKNKRRGIAHLYKSKDFMNWVKAKHPIHSRPDTGMWECPDFFPVPKSGENGLDVGITGRDVRHVLKVSLDLTRYEYYTIGRYYPEIDRYIPYDTLVDGWAGLRPDYGNFYASKSFFDPKTNRRILWGWANESDSRQDDVDKGWAGIQTIPRKVWLDPSGKQLRLWPVEEVEKLRKDPVLMENTAVELGQHVEVTGVTAAQCDVEVSFTIPSLEKAEPFDPEWVNAQDLCAPMGAKKQGGVGPFGLLTLASEDLEEATPVFFRVFKADTKYVVLMCSDASSSSLKEGLYKPSFAGFVNVDIEAEKRISLRSLIDHSVVESFGAGGKTCITSRVYPTKAVDGEAHLFVFNNGTEAVHVEKLSAWSMNRPLRMNN